MWRPPLLWSNFVGHNSSGSIKQAQIIYLITLKTGIQIEEGRASTSIRFLTSGTGSIFFSTFALCPICGALLVIYKLHQEKRFSSNTCRLWCEKSHDCVLVLGNTVSHLNSHGLECYACWRNAICKFHLSGNVSHKLPSLILYRCFICLKVTCDQFCELLLSNSKIFKFRKCRFELLGSTFFK